MKKKKDIYIFLGPPGSGKGSLSQLCVKRLGWHQLSTGNLCREHINRGSSLGKQIDFAIKSGKLIEDSLILEMVHEWLDKMTPVTHEESMTVIFDGFPRTVPQAHALHELVESHEDIALKLVQLSLPDEEVMYRLQARSICQNDKCQRVYSLHKDSRLEPTKPMTCNECESPLMRRSDDEEKAIAERLRIYHQHEQALLDFYKSVNRPIQIVEAHIPLEEVYAQFLRALGTASV